MTDQIDPALYEHLKELAKIAREAGAEQVLLVRGLPYLELHAAQKLNSIPNATVSTVLPLGQAEVLLLIRFPLSDGGEKYIEEL